jgi:hypothetical protein
MNTHPDHCCEHTICRHCGAICNCPASTQHQDRWPCADHFREVVGEPESTAQDFDTEVSGVDEVEPSNPTPAFQCEGYGPARGLCPNTAREVAWYWNTGHNLCDPCHREYRTDLDQAQRDQIED